MRSLLVTSLLCSVAVAQVDPRGRSILFVRGADGSGGLGGGSFARRTEHLSDIDNTSTSAGSHGFGQLAALLRLNGFQVSQWVESNGVLDAKRLAPHRIVVFGSNNRIYSSAELAAFTAWLGSGGSAMFASDANWGSDWDAAALSDNQLLRPLGVAVYQDSAAGVPVMQRSTTNRFVAPEHPSVSGPDGSGGSNDVTVFDGEGVSYFEVLGSGSAKVTGVVSGLGFRVRLISNNGSPGPTRPAGVNDFAIVAATLGGGKVLCHFDRNTFFNRNGTGTDITRRDNATLALRIFEWLAAVKATARTFAAGCTKNTLPFFQVEPPVLGRGQQWVLGGLDVGAPSLLLLAGARQGTQPFPSCPLVPDLAASIVVPIAPAGGRGEARFGILVPLAPLLSGTLVYGQAVTVKQSGALFGVLDVSQGLELRLGFAD